MERIKIQTKHLSLGPLFYYREVYQSNTISTGFVVEVFDSTFASEYCKGIWHYPHLKTVIDGSEVQLCSIEPSYWRKLEGSGDLYISANTVKESNLLEFLVLTGTQLSLSDLENQILSNSLSTASYAR